MDNASDSQSVITKEAGNPAQARTHLPRAEDFLLWPPALQVYGYRMVNQLFASRTIRKPVTPRAFTRGEEISPTYGVLGEQLGVDAFMDRNAIAGLLVIKDGSIRLEQYGLGLNESDRWSTMSTVKSMTAMLVGAAVRDGAISLDDPVSTYLPALRGSVYDQVAIRHLLTMSSGTRWNEAYDDKSSDVNRYSKSLADKVPGGVLAMMKTLPRDHAPGARWHYNTGDTFLLGAALCSAVGTSLADYMSEKIWQPCGMEFEGFYTLESEGGQEIGGSRAGVALRDFGRFANFVLSDGVVGGKRILPEGWVVDANRTAFEFTDEDRRLYPQVASGYLQGYGYSWWIDHDGAMIAVGFAGQRIYVNRKEQLAIVTLAAFPQKGYVGERSHDHIAEVVEFTRAVRGVLRG